MTAPQQWLVGAWTVLLVLLVGISGSTAAATDSAGTAMQTQTGTVNTTLDVQDLSGPISYTNPGTIRGTLRTANGMPVANEEISLEVENRTRLVETDGDGSFAFQYRPRSARTGTTDVVIRYVPAQSAPYRGDTATVTADIAQVTPTLALDRSPSSLVNGDELTVTTAVRVDGTGISDVPVELRIGGTLFKRLVTGGNGTATTTIRLPASVPTGEQSVSAVIPYEDRAIAGARATDSITVEPRPVALSMDAARESGAIAVNGTLTTNDGQAVRGQPVQILVDGEPQGSVETDANGAFSTRLPTEGTSSVTVTARYDAAGTNFGTGEASTTVDLSGSPQTIASQIRSYLTVPVIAALLTGVVLIVLEITVRRLGLFADAVPESEEATVATDSDETEAPESTADTSASTGSPTDRMGHALAAGEYDSAVTMAYESVSEELKDSSGFQNGKTHWELLDWCEDSALSADQVEAVRTVVEAYDSAAFSADTLDHDSAEAAVERARDFQVDDV
ncbi:hypothetical protein NDI54_09840 [Haloarcula sp. S1AR25-5A]|uniref:DUF4129 domain-containing protein n=1 Tax=Haloarcula terrestris TaxID=2950533 RepID=A0AAE4EWV3_9EURY|nr:hypothetical protein [Haloarcula terrestris]MDS0221651.1 hypothetical protein [Haloarcula terrestris]